MSSYYRGGMSTLTTLHLTLIGEIAACAFSIKTVTPRDRLTSFSKQNFDAKYRKNTFLFIEYLTQRCNSAYRFWSTDADTKHVEFV